MVKRSDEPDPQGSRDRRTRRRRPGARDPGPRGDPGFRTIFEEAGIGIALVDADGRISRTNPALEYMLDRPAEELIGRRFAEFTHPGDVKKELPLFAALVQGAMQRYRIEKRYIRPDGGIVWGRLVVSIVPRKRGPWRYAIKMIEDITEEKLAEAALRESEDTAKRRLAEIETIYRSAPIGLCVLDRELRFVRINEWLAATNGLPPDAHIGRTVREIVPALADASEPLMRAVIETGEPIFDVELSGETAARPAETRFWIEHYLPIKANQRVIGINVVVEDISERARYESELRNAKRAAEIADQAKSDFLAVVSHELRTPLTTVIGYADLLRAGVAGGMNETQLTYVARIEEGARTLGAAIDQILRVVELEAGNDQVLAQEVDLCALTQPLVEVFSAQATRKDLRFHVHLPAEPIRLLTDPTKLRLILFNLLSNAVKFTREGEVVFSAQQAGEGSILVAVRDTGPGIAPELTDHIFDHFAQASRATTREQGGLGLGLTIARRLARMIGGDIAVDSEVGRGTTFTVLLPMRPSTDDGPASSASPPRPDCA